jgi:hypothetical protein
MLKVLATLVGFACVLTFSAEVWRASHKSPQYYERYAHSTKIKNERQTEKIWEWGHADPGVTFFTLCLVIIGSVQAGLFVWQLRYMRKGIEDARIAAIAAQTSAETAKQQVAVTKMGIIDLERAYMAVGPTKITLDPAQTEVTVRLLVHNTGRTGAVIQKVYGEFSQKAPVGDIPIYERWGNRPAGLWVAEN